MSERDWIVDGRPDPSRFPDPNQFATWLSNRPQHFKTHRTLSLCKNSLSGKVGSRVGSRLRVMSCDAWVYAFKPDEGWVELHHLPRDTPVDNHPFFTTKASSKASTIAPSDAAIQAALASIAGSAQAQEESP